MRLGKFVTISGVLVFCSIAFAQQSEWQDKLQEDLDYYKKQLVSECGAAESIALKWDGKLACNPREICDKDYAAVSTLCTSGLDGIRNTCQSNKVVKKEMAKVSTFTCSHGKGTLSYKLAGSKLTLYVDGAHKDNAAGQEDKFVTKLKKDLDK
jgi:hypothetical protein